MQYRPRDWYRHAPRQYWSSSYDFRRIFFRVLRSLARSLAHRDRITGEVFIREHVPTGSTTDERYSRDMMRAGKLPSLFASFSASASRIPSTMFGVSRRRRGRTNTTASTR